MFRDFIKLEEGLTFLERRSICLRYSGVFAINLLTFFGGCVLDIVLQYFAITVEKKRSSENYGLKKKRPLESTA